MAKGFHDPRYRALIEQMKGVRRRLGLKQEDVAKRLRRNQNFVSRYESGQRRLDVVELVDVARALEMDAGVLISALYDALDSPSDNGDALS